MAEYYREVEIQPGEVRHIADRLRELGTQIDSLSNEAKGLFREIDGSWEGLAKENYFAEYERLPMRLEWLGDLVRAKARQVLAIRVIIHIKETIEDLF